MSGSDCTINARTAAISAALISLPIMSFPPSRWARHGCLADARLSWGGLDRLDLVGGEVEEPAVVPLQLGEGVAGRADRDVHVAVHVVQHGLNDRLPADEEQVLGVCPSRPWPHPDPAPPGDPDAADQDMIGLGTDRGVRPRIPPRLPLGSGGGLPGWNRRVPVPRRAP